MIAGVDWIIVTLCVPYVWSLSEFSELYFMGHADRKIRGAGHVVSLRFTYEYSIATSTLSSASPLLSFFFFFFPQGAEDKCG